MIDLQILSQGILFALALTGNSQEELIQRAIREFKSGNHEQAIVTASKVIELTPQSPRGYQLRGSIYDSVERYPEALCDYNAALKLDGSLAETLNRRGAAHFKLGKIKESIEDFNAYLQLRPQKEPGHWMRGISFYYAGRYREGAKQFEGYQTVDDNDVENAVWRFLCMAREQGVDEARKMILKIGFDRRVPMMKVYEMFRGTADPDDVLADARAGKPSPDQLKNRLFYAHLYIGIFHEANHNAKLARYHIAMAAEKYPNPHYMWHVARVHMELDLKSKEKEGTSTISSDNRPEN